MNKNPFFKMILYALCLLPAWSYSYLLAISEDKKLYYAPEDVSLWSQYPLSKQYPNVQFLDTTYGAIFGKQVILCLVGFDTTRKQLIVFCSMDGHAFKSSYVPYPIKVDLKNANNGLLESNIHIGLNISQIVVHGWISFKEDGHTDTFVYKKIVTDYDSFDEHSNKWRDHSLAVEGMVDNSRTTLLKTGLLHYNNDHGNSFYRGSYRYVYVEPSPPCQHKKPYLAVYKNPPNNSNPLGRWVMSVNLTDKKDYAFYNLLTHPDRVPYSDKISLFKSYTCSDPDSRATVTGLLGYGPTCSNDEYNDTIPIHTVSFSNYYHFYYDTILLTRDKQIFFVKDKDTDQYGLASTRIGNLDTFEIVHSLSLPEDIDPQRLQTSFITLNTGHLFIVTGTTTQSNTPIQPIILRSKYDNSDYWNDISAQATLPPYIQPKEIFHAPYDGAPQKKSRCKPSPPSLIHISQCPSVPIMD